MQQEIQVDIGPDGSVRIDAAGFSGPDCEQATAFLEQALGTVTARRRKPEYHARRGTRTTQQHRLGG